MDFWDYLRDRNTKLNQAQLIEKEDARLNAERKRELVCAVNDVLARKKVLERISDDHIEFKWGGVSDIFLRDKKLSRMLFDTYFPVPQRQPHYHFTVADAAFSILREGRIRLYNLIKRQRDEYRAFYEIHGFPISDNRISVAGIDLSDIGIMSQIFYMSLSRRGEDFGDETKWIDFADRGRGARLEFDVIPKDFPDFRTVHYARQWGDARLPLLTDLQEMILARFERPFNFTGSAKMGAFFIKGRFADCQMKTNVDSCSEGMQTTMQPDISSFILMTVMGQSPHMWS